MEEEKYIIKEKAEKRKKKNRKVFGKKLVVCVLWHINHCRLFNAKSSLCIYIKYIGFGWVGVFFGISTIVGYLMSNPCGLFNVKSPLCICIKFIWFGLVGFHGISTIVGYLMRNPLFAYILNI